MWTDGIRMLSFIMGKEWQVEHEAAYHVMSSVTQHTVRKPAVSFIFILGLQITE